jgi:hypothetical protein
VGRWATRWHCRCDNRVQYCPSHGLRRRHMWSTAAGAAAALPALTMAVIPGSICFTVIHHPVVVLSDYRVGRWATRWHCRCDNRVQYCPSHGPRRRHMWSTTAAAAAAALPTLTMAVFHGSICFTLIHHPLVVLSDYRVGRWATRWHCRCDNRVQYCPSHGPRRRHMWSTAAAAAAALPALTMAVIHGSI